MRPTRERTGKLETGAAYFVSTQTADRKPFFRHERWAQLMTATLLHYAEKDFLLHAYVIMPDHLHLLVTPSETLERSVQLIKGGFSFRAKRELDWKFEIWQPGFTDHRIRDEEDWRSYLSYIRANPVEARLVADSVLFEFMGFPDITFPQGLKPRVVSGDDVRAEARTLHSGSPENCIPSGAKARVVSEDDVRAEARTLHSGNPESRIENTQIADLKNRKADLK